MSKLRIYTVMAAMGFAAASLAQVTPQQQTQPNPQPSTTETEGTAADRTPPGRTPTQQQQTMPSQAEDPRPSTSETEGTAADTTPPGRTPTQQSGSATPQEGKEIVGAAVVTPADAPLGKVVDVVFGETQQPEFVIISSEGKSVAMPYSAANSMMTTDKIVVDRTKLRSAPKLSEDQWRKDVTGKWRLDAMRYWDKS
jgi:hypothetical protein